jgi:general secretion pathway protein I
MLLSRAAARRPGLSLLEVLLALAIFLLAITALWHLVGQATLMAERAHHMAMAARIAQSKLHLVIAGKYYPIDNLGPMAADDDDDGIDDDGELHSYNWSLVYMQSSDNGPPFPQYLSQVEIHVTRTLSSGETIEVVLSQMIVDPGYIGTTQDAFLPVSSTNIPSLGYTIPGGPTGTGTTGTTGTTNTGGN